MSKHRAQKRPTTSGPGERKRTWKFSLAVAVIVVAGLVTYANSLRGPFLLDDGRAIVENASLRRLWPITAVLHPPVGSPVTGRPIVNLSFAINYALGGVRVEGYHAVNIAVHLLAALALFGVLRRTLARTELARESDGGASTALLCALVWVVHPLNTESVNYVTQRTEATMGLFYLLTLYAAIRALAPKCRGRWETIAGLAALCGVASKETTVTVPIVIALWDRVFAFPSFRAAWAQRRRLYVIVAACWLLFAFLVREAPFVSSTGFGEHVSSQIYLLNQAPLIVHYLKLAVWPHGLIFDYGTPLPVTMGNVWPSFVFVLAIVGLTCAVFVRSPALGFWGAWFFITLSPASSVIPIPTEVGAERRLYLPLVGVIVLAVVLVETLLRKLAPGTIRRSIGWTLAMATVLGLGVATMRRNVDYETGLSIWQTVLDRRPHARAHEHIAMYLRDAGRIDEAIAHLRTAAPGSASARHALASALLERGEVAGAIVEFTEFVSLRPNDPQIIVAREEFAAALVRAGDAAGAADQFRAIVSIAPEYARGHLGLADVLVRTNDLDGGIAQYRDVLRLQPNNLTALVNLGSVLSSRGRLDEAIEMLRRAVRVQPRDVDARRRLLALLLEQRKFGEGEAEARALLSVNRDDAQAHNLLGVALASQQRVAAALEQFAEALRLDPGYQDARANLARATEVLRQLPTGR